MRSLAGSVIPSVRHRPGHIFSTLHYLQYFREVGFCLGYQADLLHETDAYDRQPNELQTRIRQCDCSPEEQGVSCHHLNREC